MSNSVEEKVKSIIVEQLGVQADEVKPEASFVDDLGADSLDTVELVMAFEEAFGIEIPDEDAEKIQKVKDAIAYIESHAEAGLIGLPRVSVNPAPPPRRPRAGGVSSSRASGSSPRSASRPKENWEA